MQIGFIGLGIMGASMAENLQKAGYRLQVHDLKPGAAEPHLNRGGSWCPSPRAVAEASDVIFTSLPGPPEVEAVALGDQGLLEGMRPDTTYFDLSTNAPSLVRRINAAFSARAINMLDAPASGGPAAGRSPRVGGGRARPR